MKKCIHRIDRQEIIQNKNGYAVQVEKRSCSKYVENVICTGTLCPSYVKVDTRGSKTYGVEFYSPNDPFIREEEMKL
jgi:hypothetical protein